MAGMTYTPLQNGERSPYGGGGGKIRSRRAPKRNGTPYDRPAIGRHASAGPQAAALINSSTNGEGVKRDGWLGSRLLGTASKIVTSGASYLYSSFFKRPAGGGVLLLNDAEKPPVDNIEGPTDMLSPSAAEAESREGGSQLGEEDKTSEVESWMKRTFPREEAEKLIASLRSYVKENGTAEEQVDHVNFEGQRRAALVNPVLALESAPSNGQLSDSQRWREERTKARQEQKSNLWPGGSGKENGTPTGAGTSEVGEVVAVDVARAFMGERVTRVATPARVTLTREKIPSQIRLSPYQPSPYLLRKQQATSISTQYESASVAPGVIRNRDGALDESLRTPPVSRTVGRLLPVARINTPSPAIGYPLSGEGSKKRGSAALEDGSYSSGGPIRRLRPRSSLYTPSPVSGLQRRGGLSMYPPPSRILQTPTDAKQKSITMWNRSTETEKEETRGLATGPTSSVPERASATARKILETLDMMTPSPKEKSLDTELALVRERQPTELTTSMINEKARQTMQSWDFPAPQNLEEAGPSGRGRNLQHDLSSAAGFSWKGTEHGTKARSKGKAPVSTVSHTFEEKSTDQTPFPFQDTARLKVSESSLATPSPAIGNNQGFQINADFDDSDEEIRANVNLPTTSAATTTSFLPGKSSTSGVGSIDNNPSRPVNITAPIFGVPIAVESQRTVSEVFDGKSNAALGGFTFPSSNPFGTSLEPPPTPKPFPSPSNLGPAAKPNGLPGYKFNTGPPVDNIFQLPVDPLAEGGFDNVHATGMNSTHLLDSKSDFASSDVSAHGITTQVSAKPAEAAKGEASATPDSEISSVPAAAIAVTASSFSLSNFGAPGAGAKPVFPGIFNPNSQTPGSTPGISLSQSTTPVSTNEANFFNFGRPPPAEPVAVTPTSAVTASSLFGSSTSTSLAATTSPPTFGSSSAFGMTKAPFAFGSSASYSPGAPVLSTAPAVTSDDSNRPQKRMFGHEQIKPGDSAAVPTTVSFGLSAAATTSAPAPLSAPTFTTSGFGHGASSAPSSTNTSLFGLKPASDSAPEKSSASSPSPSTSTFGTANAFGSSTSIFSSSVSGSSNSSTSFGGASAAFGVSSSAAFGTSSTPAFGASSSAAFGASSTPAFGASSTPAFGASSTPAFGASSTPAFGASSTPAFGSSTQSSASSLFSGFGAAPNTASVSSPTTFSFGAAAGTSPFSFGGSSAASPTTSTGAFAFGASPVASPASPFNFGTKPASPSMFGMGSSVPAFGSSPNGGMGNDMEDTMADDGQMMASSPPPQQQISLFGASQTPGSSTFQFGSPATPLATPSPGVFGGFGGATTPVANPFAASPQQPAAVANPFAAPPQQSTPVANPFAVPSPGQPLNFGGGGFAVGATGQDAGAKPNRKFIKAKRAGSVKRK